MRVLAVGEVSVQRGGVIDSADSARRWRGLVCPDCRFVFRVPKDHEGSGVVCPSCHRLLRIPGSGDEVPPLIVAVEEEQSEPEKPKGEKRRRRKKKRNTVDTPWDDESMQKDRGGKRKAKMGWQWTMAGVLMAGILVWVSYALFQEDENASGEGLPTFTDAVLPEMPETAEVPEAAEVAELWYDKEEVLALCQEFLAATSVEQLLPSIRDAKRLEPEVRRYYQDRTVEGDEVSAMTFVEDGSAGDNRAVILLVQTKQSYRQRILAVCDTGDGLKVDWESWVGHSAMPWEEFMERKPTEPVLVRVLLSHVDYYNMEFSDENEWSSFRLLSPNREHVLYGYVSRVSEDQRRLFQMLSAGRGEETRVALLIRYTEDARASNQVIVDSIVENKWLIFDKKQ